MKQICKKAAAIAPLLESVANILTAVIPGIRRLENSPGNPPTMSRRGFINDDIKETFEESVGPTRRQMKQMGEEHHPHHG